ncbi:MAG: sigma-70 family RNA polymerase sigma factor [Anaerolineales bacterium]|nr:sigma-70 family RNA polymerase sigma factor [Anaerolineales bacterium]
MPKDDQYWVARALEDDPDAFAELVDAYQNQVFSVCYRMLGSPTAAEDAAQETFIRAYQALASYDQERSFGTWILSIASNYCIDQIRKRKKTLLSLDNDKYAWLAPPAKGPNPEKFTLKEEKMKQIQRLLKTLNETDRAAIVLQFWHDYSYKEIADTLSLTESAVKSRLYRARRTMAEKWQEIQENSQIQASPHVSSQRIAHESPIV